MTTRSWSTVPSTRRASPPRSARPVVVDAAHGIVALGERSAERRGPIEAGVAPDFTLPQLDGGAFTFSSLGRRKKLLLAWSSW